LRHRTQSLGLRDRHGDGEAEHAGVEAPGRAKPNITLTIERMFSHSGYRNSGINSCKPLAIIDMQRWMFRLPERAAQLPALVRPPTVKKTTH
jgi:hypothetical protein